MPLKLATLSLLALPLLTPSFAPACLFPPDPQRRGPMMIDELRDKLRKEEPSITARQKRIEDELATLDRAKLPDTDWAKEWAGRYYTGDGLGENVSICLSPHAGISFLNYGCLGLYGGDEGDIVESLPDGLTLKLVFGTPENSFLSERIYFVKWDKDRFLVPDWQMTQFVNNYNSGGFSRSSMFGIPRLVPPGGRPRMFGPDADRAGRPQLPPQFARMLLDKPVSLKVTKCQISPVDNFLDTVSAFRCTVEFSGGANSGIFEGMKFTYPIVPLEQLGIETGEIRITRVDAATCTGEFTAFAGPNAKIRYPAVDEIVMTGEQPVDPKPMPRPDNPDSK